MAEKFPMDATPEEIYAVQSKKTIKLRWTDGTHIVDKYLDVTGLPLTTTEDIIVYRVKKITYRNAVIKGIGNHTKSEEQMLYMTSTINNDVYRVLHLLRKNGYKILYPRRKWV